MPTFVVRTWIPDRPGALGAVASRIGAVRGDLVGIDILERGGGRAIDELVVDLPAEDLVSLLIAEISEVDGVDVEDVRPAGPLPVDPRLDALETAAFLVERQDVGSLMESLVRHVVRDFEADWAVIVGLDGGGPLTSLGDVPPTPWLDAFVAGSRLSLEAHRGEGGPEDVAWAEMEEAGVVVVLGRRGRPLRARERRQLVALARISSQRWTELVTRSSRAIHPSSPWSRSLHPVTS